MVLISTIIFYEAMIMDSSLNLLRIDWTGCTGLKNNDEFFQLSAPYGASELTDSGYQSRNHPFE